MKDSNYLELVKEFHDTFGQPVLTSPVPIRPSRAAFRVDLISEELEELKEGIEERDLNKIADALGDLQYVLTGTILEFGLGYKFKEIFEEIHRSNMTKACDNLKEAEETQEYYMLNHKPMTKTYSKTSGNGKFLVLRESDHKVLKSVRYSPAELTQFIK